MLRASPEYLLVKVLTMNETDSKSGVQEGSEQVIGI